MSQTPQRARRWKLALGLIAGLLSFIPNIGPVLAVIPALLLASLEGGRTVLYVAALYLFITAFNDEKN